MKKEEEREKEREMEGWKGKSCCMRSPHRCGMNFEIVFSIEKINLMLQIFCEIKHIKINNNRYESAK